MHGAEDELTDYLVDALMALRDQLGAVE